MNATATFYRCAAVGLALAISCLTCPTLARADQKAVADARKAVSDAEAGVKTAQKSVETARAGVKAKLAETPEYGEAKSALDKATADLDAASKPVLEKARAGSDYKIAAKSFADAEAKIKSIKSNAPGTPSDPTTRAQAMTEANTTRTAAKKRMDELESAALAADGAVTAARKSQSAAQMNLAALDKKVDELAATDEGYQAALKEVEEAKARLKEAQDALTAAKKQLQEESKNKRGGGGRPKGGGGGGPAGAGQ